MIEAEIMLEQIKHDGVDSTINRRSESFKGSLTPYTFRPTQRNVQMYVVSVTEMFQADEKSIHVQHLYKKK